MRASARAMTVRARYDAARAHTMVHLARFNLIRAFYGAIRGNYACHRHRRRRRDEKGGGRGEGEVGEPGANSPIATRVDRVRARNNALLKYRTTRGICQSSGRSTKRVPFYRKRGFPVNVEPGNTYVRTYVHVLFRDLIKRATSRYRARPISPRRETPARARAPLSN